MKKVLIVGALALSLAGCASTSPLTTIENAWSAATGATVPASSVVIAANTFDALEATATNYLALPKCTGKNGPVCRDPGATAKIIPAVRAGRVARANLETFMQQNPGKLGPSGLYNIFQSAIATLQGVMAQYNIKS